MDFKQIQELVRLVNKSSISELSIEEDKFKITIKREHTEVVNQMITPEQYGAAIPIPVTQQVAAPAPQGETRATEQPSPKETPVKSNQLLIKSPMIGTFYRSAGPDKPSLVNIGDEVAPGKVVCIIEAMKLFNEIESEVSGKIVKVLVEDASPVEYDQPLFLVEP
ncbi:MAG: acetyl-CoA carboxylase biotin carboxyl carrier protein [Chitinophagaceae bacterium]